ncbi:hypothetical protein SRB17_20720 [Streptomyces sp. RB17]|uniref:hypothetical protein n=1 Tax=Streptomyces sp. RB17 TaxID=2585197 RepID=UPI0012959B8F|nr:hypothetical protein [Streptomyces sp. RB17]MQY34106.1 hypothetical protein [Streptomyces sp. RB17]
MAAQREPEPERDTGPVPRDMPDQQAGTGDDPWEVRPRKPREPREQDVAPAEDAPDADEPPA